MKLDIVRGATLYADQVCLRLESGATILCDWADVERKDIRLGDTVSLTDGNNAGLEILEVVVRSNNALSIPCPNRQESES